MLFWVSFALALTLDDAWRATESRGLDAAMIEEQYRMSATARVAAWSLLAPKFVVRGSYTRNDEEITFDPNALIPEEFASIIEPSEPLVMRKLSYFDASMSVVQPIFAPSSVATVVAAGQDTRAAAEDRDAHRSMLRAGVASAFWGALVAREAVAISGTAVASAERHLDLARRRVLAGSASRQVELQAELALSRARRDLAAAEESRSIAENALASLTGWPARADLELPPAQTLPFESVEVALATSLEQRADVRASRFREAASRSASWAQGLDWLPAIDGRFTYAWTENTSAFNDKTEFWMVVVESEWVLWDGGYRLSEQLRSSSQVRLAVLARRDAEDHAEQEVRAAFLAAERAGAAHHAAEREVALADENARLAAVAFDAGTITFLDLEDARLGLSAARFAELQTRAQRELAIVELLDATGRL
ncbi:MAG: TolC family protein [Deltaproteobacteria bacterium]|nr:TolC family protein [Deltaproteobacteria bacterium]